MQALGGGADRPHVGRLSCPLPTRLRSETNHSDNNGVRGSRQAHTAAPCPTRTLLAAAAARAPAARLAASRTSRPRRRHCRRCEGGGQRGRQPVWRRGRQRGRRCRRQRQRAAAPGPSGGEERAGTASRWRAAAAGQRVGCSVAASWRRRRRRGADSRWAPLPVACLQGARTCCCRWFACRHATAADYAGEATRHGPRLVDLWLPPNPRCMQGEDTLAGTAPSDPVAFLGGFLPAAEAPSGLLCLLSEAIQGPDTQGALADVSRGVKRWGVGAALLPIPALQVWSCARMHMVHSWLPCIQVYADKATDPPPLALGLQKPRRKRCCTPLLPCAFSRRPRRW